MISKIEIAIRSMEWEKKIKRKEASAFSKLQWLGYAMQLRDGH